MEIVERFVLVLFVDDIFGPLFVGVVQTMCQFGWPAKTTRHYCDRSGRLPGQEDRLETPKDNIHAEIRKLDRFFVLIMIKVE